MTDRYDPPPDDGLWRPPSEGWIVLQILLFVYFPLACVGLILWSVP